MDTLRVVLALVPVKKLEVHQMDIKGVYLNGILKETIYMDQPKGFNNETGRVCHLIKTTYSLKQSGREWNTELDKQLTHYGFWKLISDPCAYIKWDENEISIVTVWVDNLLLFISNDEIMVRVKEYIKSTWETTDIGEPTKIISIKITLGENSISISQQNYITDILRQEHMLAANPVGTPLDLNIQLEPNLDGSNGNKSNSFACLLGELQWVANATRPDIAYAVNKLAAYTANPSLQHVTTLKWILQYLTRTKNFSITYQININNNNSIGDSSNLFFGYADTAYANANKLKSTSGYVFLASGGAIVKLKMIIVYSQSLSAVTNVI